MDWTYIDTWIVVAGALSAASCALLGCFLVLRRMSMMGDAISHAVLPGLAVAFLLTHSRGSLIMFIGAAAVGILTAVLTEWIRGFGKVEGSAAMGVTFTILFALGLVLIVQAADKVHLDPDCVLYGAIETVPMDRLELLGREVPRAVVQLGAVLALNLLAVTLFYKELRIASFDPALATTLGIPAGLMHYGLMALVAVTTVASFESVGSILVIAMLIVPAAAAHLLTDRLAWMLVIAAALGVASAGLGHWAAITLPDLLGFTDTSTAGMMAFVTGVLFVLAALLAPRHGVLSRAAHQALLRLRVAREDVLGLLYREEEAAGLAGVATDVPGVLGRGLRRWLALGQLVRRERVSRSAAGYQLTASGREQARGLIRAHRLWESYLGQEAAGTHYHQAAERLEHVTDQAMQSRLEHEARQPRRDPQGKAIPGRGEPAGPA